LLRKSNFKLLIAVVIGLAVTGTSVYYLLRFSATYQETTKIVVPTTELPPYTKITESNIRMKSVQVASVSSNAARDPSQVLGKTNISKLFEGEQISLERLTDSNMIDTFKVHAAVNVNLTRSVGGMIRPGDIVDVYWVKDEMSPAGLLAENSQVIKVTDNSGKDVLERKNANVLEQAQSGVGTGLPAVAVLAVKPSEVVEVLRGSADESKGLTLVKKFKESKVGDIVVQEYNLQSDIPRDTARDTAREANGGEESEESQNNQ